MTRAIENNKELIVWLERIRLRVCGVCGSVVEEAGDKEFRVLAYLLPASSG